MFIANVEETSHLNPLQFSLNKCLPLGLLFLDQKFGDGLFGPHPIGGVVET